MGQLSDVCKRRLDYGCGKGFDADALGMFKYDPHFFPASPAGEFDYVYCGYVLNVMNIKEGQQVMDNIMSLLTKRGKAFVVVRRDVEVAGFTSKGTYQRPAGLLGNSGCYPIVETNAYCVYSVHKGATVKVI
jgi:hypothetical protein